MSTTLPLPVPGKLTLDIDAPAVVDAICGALREQVGVVLRRRGAVVAMSGGVDSAVCASLAVRAFGAKRVLGLFLPERDSDPASLTLARALAEDLGIEHITEDVTPALDGAGCYRRRDEAIRRVIGEYGDGWRCKLVLGANRLDSDRLNVFQIAVQSPDGELQTHRLPPSEFRQIVAATNFKQRVRKMVEYYHADRLHYAVVGTPNRLEYDQGFFVKGGDGLADVKPIAHLYKTQVYALAEFLDVPEIIRSRPPTTDTYSLPQTQEEFYFELPARMMDAVLYAHNEGLSEADAAGALELRPEQVARAYREIEQKRVTTAPQHVTSLLVEPVPQVSRPHLAR
jgi:NAD+ synthase